MSLGHELLHGHPTPWTSVNSAIGFIPLSFWVPFARYKTMHVRHHRSNLTFPEDDPESLPDLKKKDEPKDPVEKKSDLEKELENK